MLAHLKIHDTNHHQIMTLVFGAIPPLAVVFAFPLLLPSVPAEKVIIWWWLSYWWISSTCKRQQIYGICERSKPTGGRRQEWRSQKQFWNLQGCSQVYIITNIDITDKHTHIIHTLIAVWYYLHHDYHQASLHWHGVCFVRDWTSHIVCLKTDRPQVLNAFNDDSMNINHNLTIMLQVRVSH